MTDSKQQTLRKIYGIALSVLSVIAGLLLIMQTQRIYHREIPDGATPYTQEIVSKYLLQILPVLIIWVLAVIVGAIIWQIFPPAEKKLIGSVSQRKRLNRLKAKLPDDKKSDNLIKAEKVNFCILIITIVYAIIALVFLCLCFFDRKYYITDPNLFNPSRDMLDMLPHFLPWLAVFFVLASLVSVYFEYSAKKEIKETKRLIIFCAKDNTLIKDGTPEDKLPPFIKTIKGKLSFLQNERFKKGMLLGCRIALPVVGVTLFIIGIFNGGLKEVLKKAIVVCTECIGIG